MHKKKRSPPVSIDKGMFMMRKQKADSGKKFKIYRFITFINRRSGFAWRSSGKKRRNSR
jgi:hypothetical protein